VVAVSPASREVAVLPASGEPRMILLPAWGPELVELAAPEPVLPGVAPPARQASRYSDSLFLQPLVSFFILSFFGWQESSRTRYKNKEFKHIAQAKSTGHLARAGGLLLCISGRQKLALFFRVLRNNPADPKAVPNANKVDVSGCSTLMRAAFNLHAAQQLPVGR